MFISYEVNKRKSVYSLKYNKYHVITQNCI